jgi:hypothetical protein
MLLLMLHAADHSPQTRSGNQDYSAKIWSGIRTIFRAADMFQAANDANISVLTNQRWFGAREALWKVWRRVKDPFNLSRFRVASRPPRPWRPTPMIPDRREQRRGRLRLLAPGRQTVIGSTKKRLASIATDPGEWLKAFVVFWLSAAAVKVAAGAIATEIFGKRPPWWTEAGLFMEPWRLLGMALSSQYSDASLDDPTAMQAFSMLFQIAFLGINTLFMAFLIAMIVRQVTRD